MAKRVNNISYKGIRHTPSLVSDADGYANECVNLSPDGNDLKPMPMPVKIEGYTVTANARLVFVHQGIGYDNYVELGDDKQTLYIKDEEGNVLYSPSWTNKSDVLAVESMGNTLVVSTTTGTEYLVYEVDNHQYKWLEQRPPMPVIEFRLAKDEVISAYTNNLDDLEYECEFIPERDQVKIYKEVVDEMTSYFKGNVAGLEAEATKRKRFFQPFFVRYALRLKTGDYIMQSPLVLMLPSTNKNPIDAFLLINMMNSSGYDYRIAGSRAYVMLTKLQYKVINDVQFGDWSEIVSGIDFFISTPIQNYDRDASLGAAFEENVAYLDKPYGGDAHVVHYDGNLDLGYGRIYADGEIQWLPLTDTSVPNAFRLYSWPIESVDGDLIYGDLKRTSLFYKVYSMDFSELEQMSTYEDLPIENLSNLATLPTLEDDYNSHCAVSPSLLQVYNSRLNMANIRQKVFDGFKNAFQPQSTNHRYDYLTNNSLNRIVVLNVYFRIKKNGKVYTVRNQVASILTNASQLDYTTYLYYPDPDCYEAVVYCKIGIVSPMNRYVTIPMKRHEYLNGSYWYDDMKCLGEYVSENNPSAWPDTPPDTSQDMWYEIPNRFMMSSVGNPWHFPVGNQFDIGRREIRALSVNAENMDAPQFGQNPIYVFSADGIWTIAINADGTFNKLSYVSGDVLSEMKHIGHSPTASAQQVTFFKTDRGIMAIIGSQVKDIGKTMKGRAFNTIAKLLPTYSVFDGIATSGVESYWLDLIKKTSDSVSFASFAKTSDLVYDYRNNRLLLLPYAQKTTYIYVYDIENDFWSKMLPLVIDESPASPAQEEYNSREVRDITLYTEFVCAAMVGSKAVFQDAEGGLWYVGQQIDENLDAERKFGFYVSRPLRFGTDDMKTLTRIVHDMQLANNSEKVGMALYGSVDGQDYWQITRLKGKSYKFFIIVLYTHIYPSSRYAYTAFEWEARMTDKIR
jgi:hypothetical protein